MREPVALFFALLAMLVVNPTMAQQILVGDDEAVVVTDGDDQIAIPIEATVTEVSLQSTRNRGDAIGILQIKVIWSTKSFARQSRDYRPIKSALAEVTVDLPGPNGKAQKMTSYAWLSPGSEETIEFSLNADVAREVRAVSTAATGGWTPTISIVVNWNDVSIPLRVRTQSRDIELRRAGRETSDVVVRIPPGVEVPPGTQIIYWAGGKESVKTLSPDSTSLGALSSGVVDVVVEHRLRNRRFRNTVDDRLPITDGVPTVTHRLPVAATTVIVEPEEFAAMSSANRYLLFLFRDRSSRIRVAYHALLDRSKTVTMKVLRRDGVLLVDGLLLGFDESSRLNTASDLDSNSFDQPDVFLGVSNERRGAAARSALLEYLGSVIPRRVRTALGATDNGRNATKIATLTSLVSQHYRATLTRTQSTVRLSDIVEPVETLNRINDPWLKEEFPGSRLSVILSLTSDRDLIRQELQTAGAVVSRSDSQGEHARKAVLEYFDRAKLGDDTWTLAHLLLANSKTRLTSDQLNRFWHRLEHPVAPRDISLTQAVSLLHEDRPVSFWDGTRLRRLGYRNGRLTLDLSELRSEGMLTHIDVEGARALELRLNSSVLPDTEYSLLTDIGPPILMLDMSGSNIGREGRAAVVNQPRATSMTIDLSDTAATIGSPTTLARLTNLDVSVRSARVELMSPFRMLTTPHLKSLKVDFGRTRWVAGVSLGGLAGADQLEFLQLNLSGATKGPGTGYDQQEGVLSLYPKLQRLYLTLPSWAGSEWLSVHADELSMKDFVVAVDPGADASRIFAQMPRMRVERAVLFLVHSILTDDTLLDIVGRIDAAELELDLRGTAVSTRAMDKVVSTPNRARSRVSVVGPGGYTKQWEMR